MSATAPYGVQAQTNKKQIVMADFAIRTSAIWEPPLSDLNDSTFIFFAWARIARSWEKTCFTIWL